MEHNVLRNSWEGKDNGFGQKNWNIGEINLCKKGVMEFFVVDNSTESKEVLMREYLLQ